MIGILRFLKEIILAKNFSIYLFRIKFLKTQKDQSLLEFDDRTPQELFRAILDEKPSIEFKEGYSWHIGNVVFLDDNVGTFKIGRKTIAPLPKYDSLNKDFIDKYEENSPNCTIYFNIEYELLGITYKSVLCPNEYAMVSRIEQLFQNSQTITKSLCNVEISNVKNPESFISRLKSAYCIKKFTVHFSGSNPFDADAQFHKPMSVYLDATGGEKGITIVDGKSLNSETLVTMSNSVAATGNEASARIQDTNSDKIITISMNKNPVKILIPVENQDDVAKISQMIIERYRKIRSNGN